MRFTVKIGVTMACALGMCALAGCGGDDGTAPKPNPSAWKYRWASRFGDAQSQFARSVAVDGSGNVIVGGYFRGTLNFGGNDLTSAGAYDVFVAKFSPAGAHIWSKSFGDAVEQTLQGVKVDYAGNVYLTGYFDGNIDFGGGTLSSAGGRDIFLAKLDPNGAYVWAKRFGDANYQQANALALDSNGNPVIVGINMGSFSFGGNTITSGGLWDVFVAKFDSDGNHVWSKGFGDGAIQNASTVAVDLSGGVIVAGYFEGIVDFGGGALVSAGGEDVFVAKFDKDGNHLWSKRFGDASTYQEAWGVAVDGSENVIVAGEFTGNVDFGGTPLSTGQNPDIFVAKLDKDGVHVWSKQYGDSQAQHAWGVAVDPSGNILLTGSFNGTVNFGGAGLSTAGALDVFLARLGPDGSYLWSNGFGNSEYQSGEAVAADASGNAVIVGYFSGAIDFGGGTLTSAGMEDVFVARFGK